MITVCLPDSDALALTEPLPDGVHAILWDGVGTPPPGIEETVFTLAGQGLPLEAMLARMPNVRVIQSLSAGVDHLAGRIPAGVTLCDAHGVHGAAVAEWILAVILASLRELPHFIHAQARHEWSQQRPAAELAGKRVLIVGAGDLGEQTASRLRAFDASPTLVGRHARNEGGGVVHGTAELPVLLAEADIVVVVVPLTAETERMVDAAFLSAMPDGALLVNAARGRVLDTDALLAELRSGRLQAALDVTDPEPLPADHPLWDAPNLLLTPHVAGTVEGFPARAYALVRAQLGRHVRGEPLANVVRGEY
jgi:phosphoglycerate dehydrogenase-like enzyme